MCVCAVCCRCSDELPSDGRGAGEQEQAAASAGLGDRRSGLGHFQTGPVNPGADSAPWTPHHAALPHPPRQVQPETAGNRSPNPEETIGKAHVL